MTKFVRDIGVSRIMRAGQLLALLSVLVEARLALSSSWDTDGPAIIAVLVAILVVGEFVRLGRFISIPQLVWVGYIARFTGLGWAGTGFLAFMFTRLVPESGGAAPVILFWSAGALAFAVSLYAFSIGRTRIDVRKFKIARSRPGAAGGATGGRPDLRITALSDLHLGEFVTAAHIRRAVEISNNESPDMVLLLGDYVDDDGSVAGELVTELTRLEAKLGVFAVLGNHDIACTDSQRLIDELEQDRTITLLRNSSAFVSVDHAGNSKNVQIIGIESADEWWSQESDKFGKEVTLSELSKSNADLTIVASHHPDVFELAAEIGVDLVVAGHTHGGQLAVPFTGRLLNVGRLVARYFWGLYELDTTTLVVSAGIGVGVIPARIGVPPEVTLLEISFD